MDVISDKYGVFDRNNRQFVAPEDGFYHFDVVLALDSYKKYAYKTVLIKNCLWWPEKCQEDDPTFRG